MDVDMIRDYKFHLRSYIFIVKLKFCEANNVLFFYK